MRVGPGKNPRAKTAADRPGAARYGLSAGRAAGGGAVGGARGALAEAQAQLSAMRSRGLTENHPDVIAAKNQVNALRAAAAAEGGGGAVGMPNPAYSSLQSILAERQANVQALSARRAAVQGEIAAQLSETGAAPLPAGPIQEGSGGLIWPVSGAVVSGCAVEPERAPARVEQPRARPANEISEFFATLQQLGARPRKGETGANARAGKGQEA